MSRLQLNFNGGEIDPDEYERVDLSLYDTGLALGLNVISRPHGGLSNRPGMPYFARLKRELSPVALSGATVALPNGGDSAGFTAGNGVVTTGNSVTDVDYVVAEFNFATATALSVVDIEDYFLDDGTAEAGGSLPGGGTTPSEALPPPRDDFKDPDNYDNIFDFSFKPQKPVGLPDPSVEIVDYTNLRVQFQVGSDWFDFGPPQDLDVGLRTRRFSEGDPRPATHWRIIAQDKGAGGNTVNISAVKLYAETSDVSAVGHVPFSFSSDQYYSIWLSDRNAEIFSNGVFLASVSIPHVAADLSRVTYVQALDTLILYHPDYPPHRLLRSGRHTAWDSRPQDYDNIPIFDYTGAALNGENAQQQLRFTDYVSGDVFNLTFAGETTRSITYGASTASSVASALGELKNLKGGGVSASGTNPITIDFTGKNGNQEWPEMFGRTIQSTSGGVVASTVRRGKAGGEDVMSATRGWPRCGSFFQQRQFIGGYKSRPATIGASVLGDYFNLNTDLESPDVGLDFTLDGADVVEIRHIIGGRNLMIFTASAEYFIASDAISRDDFQIRQASAVGCRANIRPIVVDGPALFIERRSGALRAFVFNDVEQSYVPEVISMHASHLLPDPIAMVRRPARRSKEADLIVIPNSGKDPSALLTLLRAHDIVAFTRMATDGEIVSVGVENQSAIEFAVKRGDDIYLEVFHDQCYLDASVYEITDGTAISSLSLPHLEGRQVAIMQDGNFVGRVIVQNGVATFPAPLSGFIEVGLEPDVEFKTLPLRKSSEEGGFVKDRYRIVKAHFFFETSPAFEIATAGSDKYYRYEPQKPANFQLDQALPRHFGEVIAAGMPGSSVRPDLHFRLFVPGPFHLKSLDMETSR